MPLHQICRQRRNAAIAPLTAILLIPLLALVAFAVDLGWITHTKNQLQSAADAAALAGAAQLPDNFAAYYMVSQNGQGAYSQSQAQAAILATAQRNAANYATTFAANNGAAELASLTLASNDIEFGFTDAAGNYTPQPAYAGYPNTVKVTLRRDMSANGPLGLFFGCVLGVNSVNLTATAAATIQAATVHSFQTSNSDAKIRILPMTYDVNHWNNFVTTGMGPDGNLTTDGNGNPVLPVYPSVKFTGNFGELSLDQSNDGASTLSSWIDYGVSTTDIQSDISAGVLPLSAQPPNAPPNWKGDPGLKTSTIQTTDNQVGQTYLMPLFKPVNDGSSNPANYQAGTGQGANYYYSVVQFVAIKVYSADNKSIVVKPQALIVPNSIVNGVKPAGPPTSTQTLTTIFAASKLTQ